MKTYRIVYCPARSFRKLFRMEIRANTQYEAKAIWKRNLPAGRFVILNCVEIRSE